MKILLILFVLMFHHLSFADCEQTTKSFSFIDPTDGNDFSALTKIYRPSNKSNLPVIFILPPIVGETLLDRRLVQKFCQNGIAAYIVNVVKVLTKDEEISNLMVHDHSYVRALAGIKEIIGQLQKDSKLNGQFGILGTSLGGMLAAFIAGSEPKITASVVIVGAGNIPGILANSDQEIIKAQREARMNLFKLKTKKEYEDLLKVYIPNDPINVSASIAPKSMFLFIALNDTTVPTIYQQELRKKISSPFVYEMYGNHVTGIIKASTIHSGKILNFFKQKFLK